MKPFTLLVVLALALLGAGCATHHAPAPPRPSAVSCYTDWATTLVDLRSEGVARTEVRDHLPPHAPETERLGQLLAYVYDGSPKHKAEAVTYARDLCTLATQDSVPEPTPTPPPAPARPQFWRTMGTVAAVTGLVVLGATASTLADSHSYTSTYTYKTSHGFTTSRTSCYYGRYHSSCTTR